MSWEQWLFQYKILQDREYADLKSETDRSEAMLRALRDMSIGLLGLNMLGPKTELEKKEDEKKGFDPDFPKFVPFSFLAGNPDVLRWFSNRAKKQQAEEAAAGDEDFEQTAAAIHALAKTGKPGDLPSRLAQLLTGDLSDVERNSYWRSEEAQETLARLVKPRISEGAVPHVDVRPKALEPQRISAVLNETSRPARADISPAELEKMQRALKGD